MLGLYRPASLAAFNLIPPHSSFLLNIVFLNWWGKITLFLSSKGWAVTTTTALPSHRLHRRFCYFNFCRASKHGFLTQIYTSFYGQILITSAQKWPLITFRFTRKRNIFSWSFRKEIKTIGSQAYSILDSAQGWRSFKVLSKWYSAKALETSRLHTV